MSPGWSRRNPWTPARRGYVVRTDASRKVFDKTQAVDAHRQLALVDRAFRQLKTVALEIRPVYHQLDQRIEVHVFLCPGAPGLAYYLQWHMQSRRAGTRSAVQCGRIGRGPPLDLGRCP